MEFDVESKQQTAEQWQSVCFEVVKDVNQFVVNKSNSKDFHFHHYFHHQFQVITPTYPFDMLNFTARLIHIFINHATILL